jgi:MGT family glycosyltransferase
MTSVLIVTWDGAGNLVSTLGIAQRLAHEGVDVRVLGHRSINERCGEHGWRFRPFRHTFDYDSTAPLAPEDEMPTLAREVWFSDNVARDVRDELEAEPADVLVADAMLIGALCAGEAAGVPTVALFHTAMALHRAGPMVDMMMTPMVPAVNAMRAELGLAPVDRISDIHDACAMSLVAAPQEFEPDMPVPPNAVYVGPILDGPPLSRASDELDVRDGPEPMVVVSLSTSYQDQADMLQRLADALGELPIRVMITTGPAVDPESVRAAANTRVARYVPHDRLLPHAALVVTHAGLGTVMSALSHGVPLLCFPMGRDQFFNAERVTALNAGRVLDANADATLVRDTVMQLLSDSTTRDGAKRMARRIAEYRGAAELVDALPGLARPKS